jgi:hypothetical protein
VNVRGEDAPNQIGRPFVTPPAVPTDRVQVLRSAFEETVRDTALLAEAKAQNMDISPVTGQYIEETVACLFLCRQPSSKLLA